MDESKRRFFKLVGALGLGAGVPFLRAVFPWFADAKGTEGEAGGKQLALVMDVEKCLNADVRDACISACRREHNLHEDAANPRRSLQWIRAETFGEAFPEQCHEHTPERLKTQPALTLCNHCSRPACTKVCPVKATWKRKEDGIVMMDMHRCIGCRYCMAACPYRARSFNWYSPRADSGSPSNPAYPTRAKGVVEKCTFCAERLGAGREPACVEASRKVAGGEGALTFGELSDPQSDVSLILAAKRTICRQPGFGTRPNVFYVV